VKPEIPAVTFFCLCGAGWHSLDELQVHQVEARHSPTISYGSPRQYAPADPLSPAALDDIRTGYVNDVIRKFDPMNDGTVRAAATPAEAEAIAAFTVPDSDITLDPTDPFDAAVAEIVRINRRKRADYALDGGDVFSNFRQTSEVIAVDGFGPTDAALFNVIQKIMRLRSLRANGRMADPANEAAADTYLDLAVYAIIALALSREEV
jgi:hypothetical protein